MKIFDLIIQQAMQIILLAIFIACMVAVAIGKIHQILFACVSLIMLLAISKEEKL